MGRLMELAKDRLNKSRWLALSPWWSHWVAPVGLLASGLSFQLLGWWSAVLYVALLVVGLRINVVTVGDEILSVEKAPFGRKDELSLSEITGYSISKMGGQLIPLQGIRFVTRLGSPSLLVVLPAGSKKRQRVLEGLEAEMRSKCISGII